MYLSAYHTHLAPVLLISARITALMIMAPPFANAAIPKRVKLALILILSILLHFGFEIGLGYEMTTNYELVYGLLMEFLTGAAMGLIIMLIFAGFAYAASIIAPQMGLAISQLLDPQTETMQPLLSMFVGMITVMLFISLDGHLLILKALHDSYRLVPLAGFSITGGLAEYILSTGSHLFVIAFKMAAPVLGVIIFLNTGLAIMARTIPQVNVFVVGFIITIMVGILVFSFILPAIAPFLREVMEDAVERMLWVLRTV